MGKPIRAAKPKPIRNGPIVETDKPLELPGLPPAKRQITTKGRRK